MKAEALSGVRASVGVSLGDQHPLLDEGGGAVEQVGELAEHAVALALVADPFADVACCLVVVAGGLLPELVVGDRGRRSRRT